MVLLKGWTLSSYPQQVTLEQDGLDLYKIVVKVPGADATSAPWDVTEVPIDSGKACVALEDAISEFRVAIKLPRRLEQMGGNGKRTAHPVVTV